MKRSLGPVEFSLGTASLNQDYGIGNLGKSLKPDDAASILTKAFELNVFHLDTAPSYGKVQKLIGEVSLPGYEPKVTTKISKNSCFKVEDILKEVEASLLDTNQDSFYSVLVHDSSELTGANSAIVKTGLQELLKKGYTQNIGVSVYSEEEVIMAKTSMPQLSIFQIPENICDRRNIYSSRLMELSLSGNTFFVRSAFLQGLLLMNSSELSSYFASASSTLNRLKSLADSLEQSILELCVGYVKEIPWASGLIFGVNSVPQLNELYEVFERVELGAIKDYSIFPKMPLELLDPRKWPIVN